VPEGLNGDEVDRITFIVQLLAFKRDLRHEVETFTPSRKDSTCSPFEMQQKDKSNPCNKYWFFKNKELLLTVCLFSPQTLLLVVHLQQVISASVPFSIPEEQEPGILAGSLGKHFPPPYQLLTKEYLWLDRNTGNLYTTEQKMDREALCPEDTDAEECIILHIAVVGLSRDLIQFPVIIEDINDNAPHFENGEIHLRVSEDMTVGTSFLLDDQAQDRDAGPNSELHYHLEDSEGVFSLKVEQDGRLITLVLQTALDRETRDKYHMALVTTDCGSGPLSATATLIVTVTDVNDNCPSFSSDGPRNVTVPGDSPKNTPVTRVRATDRDSGPNAAVVYSLSPKVSARAKELFSLDGLTGHIRLTRDLQSDTSEVLLLHVLASGHRCPPADTQVTVSILPKENQELTLSYSKKIQLGII